MGKGGSAYRYNEPKVHEASDKHLEVLENSSDISRSDSPLSSTLPLIRLKPLLNIRSLFLGQPLCLFRKIGYEEEEGEANDAGQGALQDEDPPPAQVAPHAAHFPDRARQQPSECSGQRRAAEEETVPPLRFGSLVPHADQIEAAGEHPCLGETEEEPGCQQTRIGLDETLTDGHEAEAEHAEGEPDMGFEALEDDVRGNLEEDVGDEEDCEAVVVFGAARLQFEVGGEAEDGGIGDVGARKRSLEGKRMEGHGGMYRSRKAKR